MRPAVIDHVSPYEQSSSPRNSESSYEEFYDDFGASHKVSDVGVTKCSQKL